MSAKLPLDEKEFEKQKANLILTGSSDSRIFYVINGMTLRSLYELKDALASMSDDTYAHHVNDERNDFSSWVKEVHNDEELANALLNTTNRKDALDMVNSRLVYLEKVTK